MKAVTALVTAILIIAGALALVFIHPGTAPAAERQLYVLDGHGRYDYHTGYLVLAPCSQQPKNVRDLFLYCDLDHLQAVWAPDTYKTYESTEAYPKPSASE